uniref:Secreted protein n=1 Tax=Syphacia muris TaxID=451379 RepID=A0A0N5AAX9_9BILA
MLMLLRTNNSNNDRYNGRCAVVVVVVVGDGGGGGGGGGGGYVYVCIDVVDTIIFAVCITQQRKSSSLHCAPTRLQTNAAAAACI